MCLLKVQQCPQCFCNSYFTVVIDEETEVQKITVSFSRSQTDGADIEPWEPDSPACPELGPLSIVPKGLNWEDFLFMESWGPEETCPCLYLSCHNFSYTRFTLQAPSLGLASVLRTSACLSKQPVQMHQVPPIKGPVLDGILCDHTLKCLNNSIFEHVFY